MKSKYSILVYLGIFIALTCFYGYMWVLIKIYSYKIDYSVDLLNKDILLSVGMSIISTIGFYLKVRISRKKAHNKGS